MVSSTPGEDPREFLRVRRPRGNTRGPRPGQGQNQGTGVPDVADRSGQDANRMFPGVSGGAGTGTSTNVQRRRAQGADKPPEFDSAEEQRRYYENIGRQRAGAPPLSSSSPIPSSTTSTSGASTSGQQPQARGGGQDDNFNRIVDTLLGGGDTQDGGEQSFDQFLESAGSSTDANANPALRQVFDAIVGQTFDDSMAEQVMDPETFEINPEFQLPMWEGQQVFLGTDDFGNTGYGIMEEDQYGSVFKLAPGQIQNEANAKQAAITAARQFFFSTDEAVRDQNLALLSQQSQAFLDQQRDEANRDFQAEQADLERSSREFIAEEDRRAAERRQLIDQQFRDHQNNLDRAQQAAQFDRQQALEEANFELAQKRFQQESQLANAQFALTLFQSFSQSPEMIHMLQASGMIPQLQQAIPGLDISALIPPMVEGEQATSALANAELPSLAQLQNMPPDVQQQVLTSIAVRTGVRREMIAQEIQRRASGQGLAGGGTGDNSLQRVPA